MSQMTVRLPTNDDLVKIDNILKTKQQQEQQQQSKTEKDVEKNFNMILDAAVTSKKSAPSHCSTKLSVDAEKISASHITSQHSNCLILKHPNFGRKVLKSIAVDQWNEYQIIHFLIETVIHNEISVASSFIDQIERLAADKTDHSMVVNTPSRPDLKGEMFSVIWTTVLMAIKYRNHQFTVFLFEKFNDCWTMELLIQMLSSAQCCGNWETFLWLIETCPIIHHLQTQNHNKTNELLLQLFCYTLCVVFTVDEITRLFNRFTVNQHVKSIQQANTLTSNKILGAILNNGLACLQTFVKFPIVKTILLENVIKGSSIMDLSLLKTVVRCTAPPSTSTSVIVESTIAIQSSFYFPHARHRTARWCCKYGVPQVVSFLVETVGEAIDFSINENVCLTYVVKRNSPELLALLLRDQRVDPCAQNYGALKLASEKGYFKLVELFFTHSKVRETSALLFHQLPSMVFVGERCGWRTTPPPPPPPPPLPTDTTSALTGTRIMKKGSPTPTTQTLMALPHPPTTTMKSEIVPLNRVPIKISSTPDGMKRKQTINDGVGCRSENGTISFQSGLSVVQYPLQSAISLSREPPATKRRVTKKNNVKLKDQPVRDLIIYADAELSRVKNITRERKTKQRIPFDLEKNTTTTTDVTNPHSLSVSDTEHTIGAPQPTIPSTIVVDSNPSNVAQISK